MTLFRPPRSGRPRVSLSIRSVPFPATAAAGPGRPAVRSNPGPRAAGPRPLFDGLPMRRPCRKGSVTDSSWPTNPKRRFQLRLPGSDPPTPAAEGRCPRPGSIRGARHQGHRPDRRLWCESCRKAVPKRSTSQAGSVVVTPIIMTVVILVLKGVEGVLNVVAHQVLVQPALVRGCGIHQAAGAIREPGRHIHLQGDVNVSACVGYDD